MSLLLRIFQDLGKSTDDPILADSFKTVGIQAFHPSLGLHLRKQLVPFEAMMEANAVLS